MRTHPVTRRRFIEMLGLAATSSTLVRSSQPTSRSATPLNGSLRKQLLEAGRVTDFNDGRILISTIEDVVYALHRNRLASAPHHQELTIDVIASEQMSERLKNALHASFYNRYGAFEIKSGVVLLNEETPYLICDMPAIGCKMAIITAPVSNDALWFIDWADLSACFNPTRIEADHPENHMIVERVGGFTA